MVIEAAGIAFVAEKVQLPVVNGLRIAVEQRYGRDALVAYNAAWGGDGGC